MKKHEVVVTTISGQRHMLPYIAKTTFEDWVDQQLDQRVIYTPEGAAIITAHIESMDWVMGT